MKRIAPLLLFVSIASIAQAVPISVELEVAGSNWGSLSVDTATGTIVDSDLRMPYGAGTPESPNGWNNFTPVTGPLEWQIVAPDLALLTLPDRIISQLTAIPDPHSPSGFVWQDQSFHYRYVTNILFEPSTLIGLDGDLFMSDHFEGIYGIATDYTVATPYSQSGSMRFINDAGWWDNDGNTHGMPQDIWIRVPEPPSMDLALMGCLAVAGVALRRKRSGAVGVLWISTEFPRLGDVVKHALALLAVATVASTGTAKGAPIVSGIPIPPNDEGVTTDLFDVAQGAAVTAASAMFPGFDARSAFGYLAPGAIEPSRVIFSDNPITTDFIEFETASPVNLASFRLILGEDIGTAKRSAMAFRLYAGVDSGDRQLVSNAAINQTYVNQYGSPSISITDAFDLQNVQSFRLELDRTSLVGFSGPRLIELDGFGVVVPEPSTWALGVLGIVTISMLRLKRRRLG